MSEAFAPVNVVSGRNKLGGFEELLETCSLGVGASRSIRAAITVAISLAMNPLLAAPVPPLTARFRRLQR